MYDVPLSKHALMLEEQIRNMIADNDKMRQFSYDPEMMCSLVFMNSVLLPTNSFYQYFLISLRTNSKQNMELTMWSNWAIQ